MISVLSSGTAAVPAETPAERSWLRRLFPVALALVFGAFAAFDLRTLNDGDTFSHVRTGLWILEHHAVPHTDIFSNSLQGTPWTAHEWLSEVLLATAHIAGSWAGVLALTGLAGGAAAYLLGRFVARYLDGLALVATSVLGVAAFQSGMLARPHVLALPVLIAWAGHLLSVRQQHRPPDLPIVAGLMLLWANLHGGWAFGLALLGLLTAERICLAPGSPGRRVAASSGWIAAIAVAVVAAAVTPNGLDGLIFPIKLALLPNLSQIAEWQSADFNHLGPTELIILALLYLGLSGHGRFDLMMTALLLLLLHMALQHRRHEMLLGAVGAMLTAMALSESTTDGLAHMLPPHPERNLLPGLVGIVAAALLVAARLASPVALFDSRVAAPTALGHTPKALQVQRVFNSYEFGGFLIFEGVPPFIDGRADMFGQKFMNDYIATLGFSADRFRAFADQNHIGWTLLRPSEPLVRTLDQDPGWRRVHADPFAVVHQRVLTR